MSAKPMRETIARWRPLLLGAIVAGVPFLAPSALAQCAMCASAAGAGEVGRGLSISILFLLTVLGAVVLALVVMVARVSVRDARDALAEE